MGLFSPVSLGEGGKVTPFIFQSPSHLFYFSRLFHMCYFLSLRAPDMLGFLFKYLICYFSPLHILLSSRNFYLCINNIFDPFFLAPQPPLTLPVFSFSPFSSTKDHLSSELPFSEDPSVTSVPSTSLSPSSALNFDTWSSVGHPIACSLVLFSSMCLTVFSESVFYCFQYDFDVCDPFHISF